jgi:DNA-binding CsgD family transcriptional regulator
VQRDPAIRPDPVRTSPRQTQILRLVASGLSDKQIAVTLGISPHTVQMHLRRLYREHGFRNRAEAVSRWLRGADSSLTRRG